MTRSLNPETRERILSLRRLERSRAIEALNRVLTEQDRLIAELELVRIVMAEHHEKLSTPAMKGRCASVPHLSAIMHGRACLSKHLEYQKQREQHLIRALATSRETVSKAQANAAKAQSALNVLEEN
jgi:hypothetical protein